MTSPKFDPDELAMNDSSGKVNSVKNNSPQKLEKDREFSAMLEHFQRAEFCTSQNLLEKLDKKYPNNLNLANFRNDLEIKISMENYAISQRSREKKQKKTAARKLSLFAIIATVIVILVFVFSFFLMDRSMTARRLAEEEAVLTSMQTQVIQLLRSGRPQSAAEIIDRMQEIIPDFEGLNDLISRAEELANLEEMYDTAIGLQNGNEFQQAYSILLEIEQEMPGLWDVNQRISMLETSFQVDELIEEGNRAFQAQDWDQVIESYEGALALQPDLDDSRIMERLLQSYFSEISRIITTEEPTNEDIEQAVEYHQKAVAMAPQSDSLLFEQEYLQELNQNLQVLRFRQLARDILADKNQTLSSLGDAISYLREAVKVQGDDSDLLLELERATIYRTAFRDFIDLNWSEAIINLQFLTGVDPNYADGNAGTMLYEAYIALGKRYDSLGLYFDALSDYQQAEILAFEDLDNLMKLFQVQIFLGNTYGQVRNFEGAISYYQYALNAIQIDDRLSNSSPLNERLIEANGMVDSERFADAFSAYQSLLEEIDIIYSSTEEVMREGTCLAFFANTHQSTVEAVIGANNLPETMVYTFRQDLTVPSIPN